jgi:hypothetical protein
MVSLPEKDPIGFLIARKFPPLRLAALQSEDLSGPRLTPMDRARHEQEIKQYRATLEALPADELQSLFESEFAKPQAEEAAELQREEDTNRPLWAPSDVKLCLSICFSVDFGRYWMPLERNLVPQEGFEPPAPSLRMMCEP